MAPHIEMAGNLEYINLVLNPGRVIHKWWYIKFTPLPLFHKFSFIFVWKMWCQKPLPLKCDKIYGRPLNSLPHNEHNELQAFLNFNFFSEILIKKLQKHWRFFSFQNFNGFSRMIWMIWMKINQAKCILIPTQFKFISKYF